MEQLFPCPSFLRVLVVEAPKAAEAVRFYKKGIFAQVVTRKAVLAHKDGQRIPHRTVQLYTSEEHFIVADLIDDPSAAGDKVMSVPMMENPNVTVTVASIVLLGDFYTRPLRALRPPTTVILRSPSVNLLVQAAIEAGAVAEGEIVESQVSCGHRREIKIVESQVSYGPLLEVNLLKRVGKVRDPFGFLLEFTWYEPTW